MASVSGVEVAARQPAAAAALPPRRMEGRLTYRLRRVPPVVLLGFVILAISIVAAVLAGVISPYDPLQRSLSLRLKGPSWLEGGVAGHLLGTDALGRDVLSRIIWGSRISLTIGFAAVVIGSVVGSLAGLVAGYVGGRVDEAIMTVADIQLAFPFILLAIAIIAVLGPSFLNLIVVVGISGWVTYARIARGEVLSLKEKEFVIAVESIGGSRWRVLFRHILANAMAPLIVVATLELARTIILESTLSFLGLGIQPPTASWGVMLADGREYLETAWWITTFPGLALTLTVLAVGRIGDWLRDVLDPTLG